MDKLTRKPAEAWVGSLPDHKPSGLDYAAVLALLDKDRRLPYDLLSSEGRVARILSIVLGDAGVEILDNRILIEIAHRLIADFGQRWLPPKHAIELEAIVRWQFLGRAEGPSEPRDIHYFYNYMCHLPRYWFYDQDGSAIFSLSPPGKSRRCTSFDIWEVKRDKPGEFAINYCTYVAIDAETGVAWSCWTHGGPSLYRPSWICAAAGILKAYQHEPRYVSVK